MISPEIRDALGAELGAGCVVHEATPLGGSSFGKVWKLATSSGPLFVKSMPESRMPMLEAEFAGLQALASAGSVRVPNPVALGASTGDAFLAIEYLELDPLEERSGRALGRALAELHAHTAESFGWQRDNFIGATPQSNRKHATWLAFFSRERIGVQLDLAVGKAGFRAADAAAIQEVMERVAELFEDYDPRPSLLHGDLWGGNAAALPDGCPVIFDPAVYFGDREADVAMCELFGGFPAEFFAAYREAWPLDAGYAQRRDLYQLYHVLNHFNLFGTTYLGQVRRLIDSLRSTLH